MPAYHDPLTPIEMAIRRRRIRNWLIGLLVLLVLGALLYHRYAPNRPVAYSGEADHFKYGSIGSDIENGLPVRILQVLPRMFPEYLPAGGPRDYTAFGLIQEEGQPLPIGFSVRRRIIDLAGLNCALCHVGQVRASAEAEPLVILGMPANTVDLQALFDFMFACAADNRFTADNIIAAIEEETWLNPLDRLLYRSAVPLLQAGLLKVKSQLEAYMFPVHPRFGPGRVDTFNPYKVNQFSEYYPPGSFSDDERIGTSDFPSVWRQRMREGLNLHWDGNNSSVRERNFSAAFGAGATRDNVDSASFDRVTEWLADLPQPPYPFDIDRMQVPRGEAVFAQYCQSCHGEGGAAYGQVDPIASIRTDPHRLNSYTEKLAGIQVAYGDGYDWDFSKFRKTDGYANQPLDGLWARAPYLHNGSVPTLWDLLTPEGQRNSGRDFFFKGHAVFDTKNVGERIDIEEIDGRKTFRFVISEPGNSNHGHSGAAYGTELSDADKRALIEFLKTL